LDDVAGEVVGSLTVPRNGAGQSWITLATPVKKITGVHNVILRFYGSSQDSLITL
jgi:hypothetical protein